MPTDMSGGPGAFRRLMNKVARWSEALNYSGFDYTLDRIASVERELAAIQDGCVNSKRHGMRRQMLLRCADPLTETLSRRP